MRMKNADTSCSTFTAWIVFLHLTRMDSLVMGMQEDVFLGAATTKLIK